jgi:hypothetical protein
MTELFLHDHHGNTLLVSVPGDDGHPVGSIDLDERRAPSIRTGALHGANIKDWSFKDTLTLTRLPNEMFSLLTFSIL